MRAPVETPALALLAVLAACAVGPPPTPPNIVVVMTDDQGWGDLAVHGNPVLETPNLGALARAGARMTRFYVNPVCSPTRAALLTGRYSHRTRVVDTWRGRSMMDPAEVTLAEALRGAGYRTGVFGKWHLGDCYPMRAIDRGFDTALVHRGGGLAQPSEPPQNDRRYTEPILFRDGAAVATEGYCTDVYFDAALQFIDESAAARRPFFVYLPTNAPHGPFHDVPERLYAKYRALDLGPILMGNEKARDQVARIFAMCENIDGNVGRLLARLDARGITGETIVVYLHDNGPQLRRYVGPMRGTKTEVHEGGIRSPLFFRWPGHVQAGRVIETIGAHIDLMPTLLDAAGVPPPAGVHLDGRSLLPLLLGRTVAWPERQIHIQSHRGDAPVEGHNFAVIGPRYKLLRASGFGREQPRPDSPFLLYDIPADPFEARDLAAAHPDIVTCMRADHARWLAAVRPPDAAPPRIVVGTDHETTTTLTTQDWRAAGGGWGRDGVWKLRAPAARRFAVSLQFADEPRVDAATLRIDARSIDVTPGPAQPLPRLGTRHPARGFGVELGAHELPAGEFDFGVRLTGGGRAVPPHHVVLRRL